MCNVVCGRWRVGCIEFMPLAEVDDMLITLDDMLITLDDLLMTCWSLLMTC